MDITPITANSPGCYGVCCPKHQQCGRYYLVNGAPAALPVIGTCETGHDERPLFIEAKKAPLTP